MKKLFSLLLACLFLMGTGTAALAAPNRKGDIDADLEVSVDDARLALRQAVGLEALPPRQLAAADLDGDGEVAVADARSILRVAVGLEDYETLASQAVEEMLRSMSTEEKIAQMLMPSVRYFNGDPVETLPAALSDMLAKHPFAGVILFAQNTQTAEQTLRLTDALQKANAKAGRPQLLIAADQEGGTITRLATGTQTPGNMALGAIGEESAAREAAGIIGSELAAVGINVNFAPVMDVNSEPSNPVIGVRSFSDDPNLAAKLGGAYVSGLQDENVAAALKHFPGHGDTSTDSHTGLPRVEKSYEALKRCELLPFAAGIAEGAEMIMTAHIQFPQIEKETYVSRSSGKRIALPATLSKKIITDVLRGDMGYRGVVVTDAMNMDAIDTHFAPLDAAVLAINAGVDILLIPLQTSSNAWIAEQDKYIKDLSALVGSGRIPTEKVDAAVRRILRLKYDKGLFDVYESPALSAAVEKAKATLGSAAHHEAEWALAKRAVTLVQNKNGALPLKTDNKKILLLAAYPNEVLSMRYGADRLRGEGRLPSSATVTADCYTETSMDRVLAEAKAADIVIAISEVYRESALDPRISAGRNGEKLDRLISAVHGRGGKIIVVSAHLPYDAARFTAADAVLVCWSDKGMSEDPRVKGGDVTQYGPNIPAAVYLALSREESPAGKLPVNIPKLTSDYTYSGQILYPFGFGLRY